MLYHIEINWPKGIPTTLYDIPVRLTRHAEERSKTKGITVPQRLTGKAFECELLEGRVNKLAIRCRYSTTHDLIAIIAADGSVITMWLNAVNDTHNTLDKSRYVQKRSA